MRTVHKLMVDKGSESNLKEKHRNFLKIYFQTICDRPNLEEIKNVAQFLDVEKESVYWWFFNQRCKQKRISKEQKRVKVIEGDTKIQVKPQSKPMLSIENIFKSRNKKSATSAAENSKDIGSRDGVSVRTSTRRASKKD